MHLQVAVVVAEEEAVEVEAEEDEAEAFSGKQAGKVAHGPTYHSPMK